MLRHEGPLYEWARFGTGYIRRLIESGKDHEWEEVADADVPTDIAEQDVALTVRKREIEALGPSGGSLTTDRV